MDFFSIAPKALVLCICWSSTCEGGGCCMELWWICWATLWRCSISSSIVDGAARRIWSIVQYCSVLCSIVQRGGIYGGVAVEEFIVQPQQEQPAGKGLTVIHTVHTDTLMHIIHTDTLHWYSDTQGYTVTHSGTVFTVPHNKSGLQATQTQW